jgi:hypothetical protein
MGVEVPSALEWHAQTDPRITKSMESLKAMTAKLGAPKLEGKEAVGGKEAPACGQRGRTAFLPGRSW